MIGGKRRELYLVTAHLIGDGLALSFARLDHHHSLILDFLGKLLNANDGNDGADAREDDKGYPQAQIDSVAPISASTRST